jgi:hypothetical protein
LQDALYFGFPYLREAGDFILLSLSLYPIMLLSLQDFYSYNKLKAIASGLYGKAALETPEDGLACTLDKLSDEFDKHLEVMEQFSKKYRNQ